MKKFKALKCARHVLVRASDPPEAIGFVLLPQDADKTEFQESLAVVVESFDGSEYAVGDTVLFDRDYEQARIKIPGLHGNLWLLPEWDIKGKVVNNAITPSSKRVFFVPALNPNEKDTSPSGIVTVRSGRIPMKQGRVIAVGSKVDPEIKIGSTVIVEDRYAAFAHTKSHGDFFVSEYQYILALL